MDMDTPLLLIAWRRPHTLRRVINAIRPVAPTRIFVACDGPNPDRPGERENVAATRAVIETEIDWPCQIECFYSDVNQGCRQGVSRAITWFFEQVEEGIILEDDCVPHPDFFPYCTTLLELYRHDTRVWCISGNNFEDIPWKNNNDYFFSSIPMIWGWATWRSRWIHYDSSLLQWPKFKHEKFADSFFGDPVMTRFWRRIWDNIYLCGKPDTWDYQWVFTCVSNSGLSVIPRFNLIYNIGFGSGATHTNKWRAPQEVGGFENADQLDHATFVCRDAYVDGFVFDSHFGGRFLRLPRAVYFYPSGFIRKSLRCLHNAFSR